jgi:hypothetical protein
MLDIERRPFVVRKGQRFQLADLHRAVRAREAHRLGPPLAVRNALRHRASRAGRPPGVVGEAGQSGVGVEQLALGVAAQQRLVCVLTVDVDEPFSDFAQLLRSRRRTVDVGARTAAGINDAAQQQFVAGIEVVGGKPVADRGQRRDIEGRGDFRLVAAGADDAGVGGGRRGREASASIRIDLPGAVSPVSAPKRRKLEFRAGRR